MRWKGAGQSKNLEDRRGQGGRGLAMGGGGALVLVIIGLFLGVDPQQLIQVMDQTQDGGNVATEDRPLSAEEQQTGQFTATVLHFTETVWTQQFQHGGKRYEAPRMVLFSDRVETGCGVAPAAVGPFYCPTDKTVYLDPTFFDELERELGGSKAEFSQAYVIAHEVGHHVQNLLGYSALVEEKRRTLAKEEYNQWSVRLELQADYLAGVWAHHAQKEFNFIEPGDIESAIKSANAIGDDRLQKRSTGFTSPENYTHGTSAQRVQWFRAGLESGDMGRLAEIFENP